MQGLILIQSVWHQDGIPERNFRKKLILKISADDEKKENFPGGIELNHYTRNRTII